MATKQFITEIGWTLNPTKLTYRKKSILQSETFRVNRKGKNYIDMSLIVKKNNNNGKEYVGIFIVPEFKNNKEIDMSGTTFSIIKNNKYHSCNLSRTFQPGTTMGKLISDDWGFNKFVQYKLMSDIFLTDNNLYIEANVVLTE
jgi:hypothetical protein